MGKNCPIVSQTGQLPDAVWQHNCLGEKEVITEKPERMSSLGETNIFGLCSNGRPRAVRAGFTLLEAVVSVAITGFIFVALYSGLTYGTGTIRMSRENLRATQLLSEKMDTFRLYTWSQITDDKFIPDTFTAAYSPNGGTNNQGVIYSGTIKIDKMDKDPDKDVFKDLNYADDMRRVTVTLTWKTGSITRTRTLSTLIARYGLQNYVF